MGRLLTLLLMVVLVLAGCHKVKTPVVAYSDEGAHLPAARGPGAVPHPDSPIPDVPMPVGFRPLPTQSHVSFDGVSRQLVHVYQGRAHPGEIRLMYTQNLPRYQWQKQSVEEAGRNTTILHYTKGRERLTVTIRRSYSVINLTIEINPY